STNTAEVVSSDAGAPVAAQRANLDARRLNLQRQLEELRKSKTDNHPEVAQLRAELDAIERELGTVRVRDEQRRVSVASASRRPVIDTSFTMDIGETVVDGT